MKKISITAVIIAIMCLFCACSSKAKDTDTNDTTLPVTNPQGYEDVTAPPEDSDKEADTTSETEVDTTADSAAEDKSITSIEEAVQAAKEYLGESDPETGYAYAYSYDGMMTDNGVEYYKIRVSWYIEEQERYSLCGELLVSPDGSVSKFNW